VFAGWIRSKRFENLANFPIDHPALFVEGKL
jgi:hypothetical protein